MITKCRSCGNNDFMEYLTSCNYPKYFRKCKSCQTLTYKNFPYYIPKKQRYRYIRMLNKMSPL
jgi:hypothetical protein